MSSDLPLPPCDDSRGQRYVAVAKGVVLFPLASGVGIKIPLEQ